MSQRVGELVKSGQPRNLMSITIYMWESTTTAGILMRILKEFGATPLTQISDGSTALFQYVPRQRRKCLTFRLTMTKCQEES